VKFYHGNRRTLPVLITNLNLNPTKKQSKIMALHINQESGQIKLRNDSAKQRSTTAGSRDGGPTMQKALRLAHRNELQSAIELLTSGSTDEATRNALGVCLLRAGKIDDAVRVFRSFVLGVGGTTERSDAPAIYKRNFATALLLAGQIAGCVDTLRNSGEPDHPRTVELRTAIKRWERTLSFFRRWDWKLNQIEPRNRPVSIEFVPGEFEFDLADKQSLERQKGTGVV